MPAGDFRVGCSLFTPFMLPTLRHGSTAFLDISYSHCFARGRASFAVHAARLGTASTLTSPSIQRTHTCDELRLADVGLEVNLTGWLLPERCVKFLVELLAIRLKVSL